MEESLVLLVLVSVPFLMSLAGTLDILIVFWCYAIYNYMVFVCSQKVS